MKIFYCLIFLGLISGHVEASEAPSVADVADHEALWDSQKLSSISFTVKEGGPFGYIEYKIKIIGEQCIARSRSVFVKNYGRWRSDVCSSHTISDQFKRVNDQLNAGVIQAKISFNSNYGYIDFFSAEPDVGAFDQGWYIEISDFSAKSKK